MALLARYVHSMLPPRLFALLISGIILAVGAVGAVVLSIVAGYVLKSPTLGWTGETQQDRQETAAQHQLLLDSACQLQELTELCLKDVHDHKHGVLHGTLRAPLTDCCAVQAAV